jgi:CheY-like chemotaxis protein
MAGGARKEQAGRVHEARHIGGHPGGRQAGEAATRVLLVDDEPLVLKAMKMLLAIEGFTAQAADSGPAALAHLEAGRFDLVITDNAMPGMSGVELAGVIKTRWPSMPVIMLSGNPPSQPLACLDLVLHKPGDASILAESIRKMVVPHTPRNPRDQGVSARATPPRRHQ